MNMFLSMCAYDEKTSEWGGYLRRSKSSVHVCDMARLSRTQYIQTRSRDSGTLQTFVPEPVL